MANNFISSIGNDKERVIYSKSDNIEIMVNNEAEEVKRQFSDLLKNRYQNNFESMEGSEFVFDYVNLLYYKCHKINPNRGESYIDSPDWIKKGKNKKDSKCFQYGVTVVLNHEEIKEDPQRIIKIKPFINSYYQEETKLPSEKDDWKKFEKNSVAIALSVLYAKKEKVYPTYVSKHKSNREEQVIL